MNEAAEMIQRPKVCIAALDSYDDFEAVLAAVRRSLEPLGGMAHFVRPGQRVLLKPNLVAPSRPEQAISPDPSILRAAIRLVKECGGIVKVGDGPGVGGTRMVLASCGMLKVIEEEGAEVAEFKETAVYENPDNRVIRRLDLTAHLQDCDVLISLPKLKTHVQMAYTGAVKNQFGLIPGSAKGQFHFRLQNRDLFSDLMIDINRTARPALAIMDAVVGMEGPGPNGGTPRKIGAVVSGADLPAVDVVCCSIIGLDPETVPINLAARRGSYGTTRLQDIEVCGEDWHRFYIPDYNLVKMPSNIMRILPLPVWALRWIRRQFVPRPVIRTERCIRCGNCERGCPVRPAAIHPLAPGGPKLDPTCIRCYCCHEFCPVKAIDLQPSLLDRIFHLRRLADLCSMATGKAVAFLRRR